MVDGSYGGSVFSYFDATKFRPFHVFHNYYIHYSTWLGAIWPLGCATLLVIYGGSDFIQWLQVPETEDTAFTPTPATFANAMPSLTVQFFPRDNGTDELSTSPYRDPSVFTVELYQCERVRAFNGSTTTETVRVGGVPVTFEREVQGNFTESCWRLPVNNASLSSSVTLAESGFMQGSRAERVFRYVRMDVQRCRTGQTLSELYMFQDLSQCEPAPVDNSTECPPPSVATEYLFSCRDSTTVDEIMQGGEFVVTFASQVPAGLASLREDDEDESFEYDTTFSFPYNGDTEYVPQLMMEPQVVEVFPSYFGDHDTYQFAEPQRLNSLYNGDVGVSEQRVVSMSLEFDSKLRTTRFIPVTLLFKIAQLGQVIAAIFVVNFFIYRINFAAFYFQATKEYFVPDVGTRKFLLSDRNMKIKDYENALMYTFTFGGTDRFGLQTRHLYEYFTDRKKRFNRRRTQAVVEDVRKFLVQKRIGRFVSEERRENRIEGQDEADYDINTANPHGDVTVQQLAMRGQAKFDDDDDLEDLTVAQTRARSAIREVETTLKLCTLQDELTKMKVIAATLFPTHAKQYGLAEKLSPYDKKPSAT